jgi:hypothetical protein
MGYRSISQVKPRADGTVQRRKFQPRARDVLVSWARAQDYRKREANYLALAQSAPDSDARNRLVTIARHYRSLAEIEQSIADQRPIKSVIEAELLTKEEAPSADREVLNRSRDIVIDRALMLRAR